jgi:4a-hydroxytetrahydrobiopterin dehydratase
VLSEKHCQPVTKGSPPLSYTEIELLLNELHSDWQLSNENAAIRKEFSFSDYYQTMAFVNATAWIAHQQDHHPEITISYNHCVIQYTTHATNGLTENDFICAAKIDLLLTSPTR